MDLRYVENRQRFLRRVPPPTVSKGLPYHHFQEQQQQQHHYYHHRLPLPPPHFRRRVSNEENLTPPSSSSKSTIEIKMRPIKRNNSNKRKQEESQSVFEERYSNQVEELSIFKRRMTSHDEDGDERRDDPSSPSDIPTSRMAEARDTHDSHPEVKRVGSSELASAVALASLAYGNSSEMTPNNVIQSRSRQVSASSTSSMSKSSRTRTNTSSHVSHPQELFIRSCLSSTSSYGSFGMSNLHLQERMNHNQSYQGYNLPFELHHTHRRQQLPVPVPPPEKKKWVCDYCNDQSFPTFKEACVHEETCSFNHNRNASTLDIDTDTDVDTNADTYADADTKNHAPTHALLIPDNAQSGSSNTESLEAKSGISFKTTISPDEIRSKYQGLYFEGAIPLSVSGTDSDWLSDTNCFVRSKCVEAFSANEDDIMVSSKRGRISLYQVGIRCIFCSNQDSKNQASGAVSFPVSVSGIYESVKRWKTVHLTECQFIPHEVKDKLKDMEKSCVPTTRQYWVDSAKALGIDDTPDGLRFVSNPSKLNIDKAHLNMIKTRFAPSWTKNSSLSEGSDAAKGNHLVFPEDESTVTPFVYLLMRQVQTCVFTEADSFLSRSKSSVGFAGFECRHCHGHAGLGRYFPSSPKALSTNSTSQNIYSHVQKCRKCPQEVKDELKNLKSEKTTWLRRTCGWRQAFFSLLWERLHG